MPVSGTISRSGLHLVLQCRNRRIAHLGRRRPGSFRQVIRPVFPVSSISCGGIVYTLPRRSAAVSHSHSARSLERVARWSRVIGAAVIGTIGYLACLTWSRKRM